MRLNAVISGSLEEKKTSHFFNRHRKISPPPLISSHFSYKSNVPVLLNRFMTIWSLKRAIVDQWSDDGNALQTTVESWYDIDP